MENNNKYKLDAAVKPICKKCLEQIGVEFCPRADCQVNLDYKYKE